jgi:hypothetical protein
MFDLSLKETTDFYGNFLGIQFEVVNGQIQFCTGLEMIRQQIRNLLYTWVNQWFLDVTFGIDYASQLGRQRQELITLEIISKVAQINEVSKILNCQATVVDGIMIIELSVLVKNEVLQFKVSPNVQ